MFNSRQAWVYRQCPCEDRFVIFNLLEIEFPEPTRIKRPRLAAHEWNAPAKITKMMTSAENLNHLSAPTIDRRHSWGILRDHHSPAPSYIQNY